MFPFSQGPVLVALDFSAYSEAALAWAASFAASNDAELVVLHVVHEPAEAPGYYTNLLHQSGAKASNEMLTIEEAAEKATHHFLRNACAAIPELGDPAELDIRIVSGVPATRIVELATELDARLIVMGSHGRTGLGHLLLGSKAEEVVGKSPLPVTIVKLPAGERNSSDDRDQSSPKKP
jgi:nucleotide-binding universal stress UspA family protein